MSTLSRVRSYLTKTWCFQAFLIALLAPLRAMGADNDTYPLLTNVVQLSANDSISTCYHIQLEGDVWWVNRAANELVLHDASGSAKLEFDFAGQSATTGQHLQITGHAPAACIGNGYRLGVIGPVVDNNGLHGMIEKSGDVYLQAGRRPLRLDWFNGINQYGLEVEFTGPGLPRQNVPAADLFQTTADGQSGLTYSAYEMPGEVLPAFDHLTAFSTGVVATFDLPALPHPEHIGVRFAGALAVPRDGLYTFFTKSDDGSQLFIGQAPLQTKTSGPGQFPSPQPISLGQPLAESNDLTWATAEGTVTFVSEWGAGLEIDLTSGTGRLRVEVADGRGLSAAQLAGRNLRAIGVCESGLTADGQRMADTLLVSGAENIKLLEMAPSSVTGTGTNELPWLTTAAEVHRLKREEAERGYPVRIRGVVTCVLPEHQAFTLQDETRGVYIQDFSESRAFLPHIGESLEVVGITDPSLFAPIVNAQHLKSLGAGHLPEAARPTWDQLLNGSLDAQYVELEGIITGTTATNITLLTRDGRINVELRLAGAPADESLARYEDALVHVRGILLANWNYVTHEVTVGEIRVYGAAISVEQPVPEDLFALPTKSVDDLLRFDPQASVFQRVKVSGQIEHVRGAEYYLTDGHNPLRFIARKPSDLQPGDTVDVVGFPDLSGASPLLREAVARKTGHSTLPVAQLLPVENLARADSDARLVRVSGTLVSVRQTDTELIFEIQNGVRTFAARLNAPDSQLKSLPVGCLLELTGVSASLGVNRAAGQNISASELLLNSPADIQVLARPPWWTLTRLLIIVGALVCGLAITVLWITQLHRKVEQRTTELAAQIQERQRVEQQHAMEQERARVAQDLHDELGSSLTEISMLGARAHSPTATDDKRKLYLEQMSVKAREMVAALDEIVWAMNPRHDSLSSLVSYFCLYADRFLGLANIAWRLEGAPVPDNFVVDSRHRHHLFLAFKEGLTNVVRHSGAKEVRLGIAIEGGEVRLFISDNGRGLPTSLRTEEMDGVVNMRARLEKLGGRFEITSEPGRGTTLRFFVPAH